MEFVDRKDLVWRLQRWHGNPEMALDEIEDYLDYLQGHTLRRPPIKNEGVHMAKKDEKKDDPDIAQAKENLKKMADEVKKRDESIGRDDAR